MSLVPSCCDANLTAKSMPTAPLLDETANAASTGHCTFSRTPEAEFQGADLSEIVDEAPMQMKKEMPLEIVTSTFQKLVSVPSFYQRCSDR